MFQVNERDYVTELYGKIKADQDKYCDWLLTQKPNEILNHTYEYTMHECIVMAMEELEFSPKRTVSPEVSEQARQIDLLTYL